MESDMEALDACLPDTLPVIPGAVLAGTYVLAGDAANHRGDGLKAVPLPDRRLVLVVGDALGHGATSSTAMARLLAIVRGHLESGVPPAAAVRLVDSYAAHAQYTRGATMAAAVVNLEDGTAQVVSAGHPAPLVCLPDGSCDFVPLSPSRPLGLGGRVEEADIDLPEDGVLAMYTDGLLTARGRQADQVRAELRAGARELYDSHRPFGGVTHAAVEGLGHDLLTRMQQPGGYRDDIALLLAARVRPSPPFGRVIEASQERVDLLLGELDEWLEGVGAGLLDQIALRHAVAEIATNVVRHAYVHTTPGSVELEARLTDAGTVLVEICDSGRWRDAGGPGGRGLVVAGGLVDSLRVARGESGTRVTLEQALGRPVPLLNSANGVLPGRGTRGQDEPMSFKLSGPVLLVSGAVTDATVGEFSAALNESTRAATRDTTVDLDGVTHLSSAAVTALFDYLHRAEDSGSRLEVRCGRHSTAHVVLREVNLPHLSA